MTDLLGPADVPNSTTVAPTDTTTFGANDTYFQDCPPGSSSGGTFLSALWFNRILLQIRNLIRGMGVAVNNADPNMLLKAVQLAGKAAPYGVDTGTSGAIVVTLAPVITAFNPGDVIRVKMINTCLGATTITPNGLGPYNLTHNDATALVPNDYVIGQILEMRFDGTEFQIGKSATPAAGSVTSAALAAGAAPLPYVGTQPSDNLHFSNDGTNPNRDTNTSVGRVRDDADVTNLQLAGAMAKRLDTAWAAGGTVGGTSGGACDTGTKGNNQTWHHYLIGKLGMSVTNYARAANVASLTIAGHGLGVGSSLRVVGIGGGFDGLQAVTAVTTNTVSYNNGGANVSTTAAAATADGFDILASQSYPSPTMPSGWTAKQCLYSVTTDGSGNIRPTVQIGDQFLLKTSPSITPSLISANRVAIALTGVPSGVQVEAHFRATLDNGGNDSIIFTALDETDQATSQTTIADLTNTSSGVVSGSFTRRTDTSAQIGGRGNAALTPQVNPYGWRDPRRRLF